MSSVKIYDGEKFVNFNISNVIELPVGFEYYVPYSELDSGQLIRDGKIVSRSVYKDLWDFVQKHPSLLLTEEQWQAELSANEGIVNNYYSSGDGSTTFRLPKAGVIELPVITAEGLNKFSTDTQRNISGSITRVDTIGKTQVSNGALLAKVTDISSSVNNSGNWSNTITIDSDASRSVGTEHTGSEVKPKTITKLAVVQAFGRIINTGTLDINDLVNDVNNLIQSNYIKTYTDLSQIGITKGTETLKAIGKALPDNSMLIYSIFSESGHNNVEYPYVSGQFRIIKSKNYCSLYFQTDFGRSYEKYFDNRDIYYIENSWKKIADKDKLRVPSNTKIAISLTNQGDSYTPSCDGLIWAKKSGTNSGSYMIISDTPEIENSTFGQVLYDDYGGQYVYNTQGCCTVAKNQTMYFFWNYNAIVNFIPFKNENYTLYGEDYRIYIKVTDADGNILKDANVKILSSSGTQIVSGTTSGDGRFFIPVAKLQELFNYISYTIEVTYGSATESLIYMRNQIDKEAINDITISMSGITGGGGATDKVSITNTNYGEYGNVAINNQTVASLEVDKGSQVSLLATPNLGYKFVNFRINDKSNSSTNPTTFIATENTTFKAVFEEDINIDIPTPPETANVYIQVQKGGSNLVNTTAKVYVKNLADNTELWSGTTDGTGLVKLDPIYYTTGNLLVTAKVGLKEQSILISSDTLETLFEDTTFYVNIIDALKIINTIDNKETKSTEIGYRIEDGNGTIIVPEILSNVSGINEWIGLTLDLGTYYIKNTKVPSGVTLLKEPIELNITKTTPITKTLVVNLTKGFELP